MNSLANVEKVARGIMYDHGQTHLKFRFSKGVRQIAALHYHRHVGNIRVPHTIALSRRWALVMPMDEIREVMLHEIAHSMTIDARLPHGPEFRKAVRSLGGKATNRCFIPSVYIDGTPRN